MRYNPHPGTRGNCSSGSCGSDCSTCESHVGYDLLGVAKTSLRHAGGQEKNRTPALPDEDPNGGGWLPDDNCPGPSDDPGEPPEGYYWEWQCLKGWVLVSDGLVSEQPTATTQEEKELCPHDLHIEAVVDSGDMGGRSKYDEAAIASRESSPLIGSFRAFSNGAYRVPPLGSYSGPGSFPGRTFSNWNVVRILVIMVYDCCGKAPKIDVYRSNNRKTQDFGESIRLKGQQNIYKGVFADSGDSRAAVDMRNYRRNEKEHVKRMRAKVQSGTAKGKTEGGLCFLAYTDTVGTAADSGFFQGIEFVYTGSAQFPQYRDGTGAVTLVQKSVRIRLDVSSGGAISAQNIGGAYQVR